MLLPRIITAVLLALPAPTGFTRINNPGGPSAYTGMRTYGPEETPCQPVIASPEVEVTAERNEPVLNRAENIESLTRNSTGVYHPEGATGPAWHTQGLTQSSFVYKRNIEAQKISMSNGLACIQVSKINLVIVLQPTVWVANEFPPGTCMYNAIAGHEQKHVNVDRVVTDRHLPKIRAALVQLSQGRGLFGPNADSGVQSQYDQFIQQIQDVLDDEIKDMSDEEHREQQQVDTLREYQRVSNLCPGRR